MKKWVVICSWPLNTYPASIAAMCDTPEKAEEELAYYQKVNLSANFNISIIEIDTKPEYDKGYALCRARVADALDEIDELYEVTGDYILAKIDGEEMPC